MRVVVGSLPPPPATTSTAMSPANPAATSSRRWPSPTAPAAGWWSPLRLGQEIRLLFCGFSEIRSNWHCLRSLDKMHADCANCGGGKRISGKAKESTSTGSAHCPTSLHFHAVLREHGSHSPKDELSGGPLVRTSGILCRRLEQEIG